MDKTWDQAFEHSILHSQAMEDVLSGQSSLHFPKLCRLYLKLLPMSLSCIHIAFGKSIVLTTASMFTLEGGWPCQHQWTPNDRCSDNIYKKDKNSNNDDPKYQFCSCTITLAIMSRIEKEWNILFKNLHHLNHQMSATFTLFTLTFVDIWGNF